MGFVIWSLCVLLAGIAVGFWGSRARAGRGELLDAAAQLRAASEQAHREECAVRFCEDDCLVFDGTRLQRDVQGGSV
jgi:hypothetical protein